MFLIVFPLYKVLFLVIRFYRQTYGFIARNLIKLNNVNLRVLKILLRALLGISENNIRLFFYITQ